MVYRNSKEMAQRRSAQSCKRLFNSWFAQNYDALKEKCVFKNLFGEIVFKWHEDIFHNTYLFMYDEITNETKEDFETLFVSYFRTFCRRALNAAIKEIVPEETFWKYQQQIIEEETNEDLAKKEAKHDFAVQLIAAAKATFSRDEFTLFELHFKSGFNFREIGEFFGTTSAAVQIRYNTLCSRLNSLYNVSFNSL